MVAGQEDHPDVTDKYTHVSCPVCQQAFGLGRPDVIDAGADRALIDALVDGSLFRVHCPHCQSDLNLDLPVIVYFPDRALPIWFLHAQGTDNKQDTADFRRLLAGFQVSRPDGWDEAWWQLFWVSGRAEFSEVALQRRSVPVDSRALLPGIIQLSRAETMEQTRGVLEAHPELISDEVQQLLNEIVDQHWLRRDEDGAADFEDDRALLQSCREIGIEETLGDIDRAVSPALTELHDAVDLANEQHEKAPSHAGLETREQAYQLMMAHPEFHLALKGFSWRIFFGRALMNRHWFEQERDIDRLDRAIADIEQALLMMPRLSLRERCSLLNSHGKWRLDRYERLRNKGDLDAAISTWQEAYALAPKGQLKSLMIVGNLGRSLKDRFTASGDVTDLDRAVEFLDEGYKTARVFNQRSGIVPALTSLGITYCLRYESRGDADDLTRAVGALTEACANARDDLTGFRRAAGNLSRVLRTKYDRNGNLSDLDQAIDILRQLAGSDGVDDVGWILHNLGGACLTRHGRTHDRRDLDASIAALELAIVKSRTPTFLASLAKGLLTRYNLDADIKDLGHALELMDEAIASHPSPEEPASFRSLAGQACEAAFERNGERVWIDKAVEHYQEAHDNLAPDTPVLTAALHQLGRALLERHRRFKDPRDATRADRHLDHACQTGLTRAPQQAFAAGRVWGDWSVDREMWDTAGRAFNYAEQAASKLLLAQPDRESKAVLLKAFQGLATARAHCLAKLGRPEDAVTALEDGRTQLRDGAPTVVNQSALNRLIAMGEGVLSQRYRDLRVEISNLEREAAGAEAIETIHAALRETIKRIDELLDLDGSRNTVSFADVAAKTRGARPRSIIYLATYRERTLALIVAQGRTRAAWLPLDAEGLEQLLLERKPKEALSIEETAALHVERRVYSVYETKDARVHSYRPRVPDAFLSPDQPWSRERYLEVGAVTGGWLAAQRGLLGYREVLDAVMRVLWSQVMEPLDAELLKAAPDSLTTVLVPCGELALLPLHAAWEQFVTADHSSRVFGYLPAVRMLRSSAPPVSIEPSHGSSFLGVGNAQAQTAPLDYAELEIEVCGAIMGAPPDSIRVRNAASHDEVISRIHAASLLHFACHGRFDVADPMASAVYLANGVPLTLSEIRQLRLPRAPLVILSACETAITDTRFLPDEALGLATGFLEAGASGVVSTLWPVNDVSTMLLMEQFYVHYFKDGRPAVEALRDAREGLRHLRASEVSSHFDALRSTFPKGHPLASAVIREYRRSVAMRSDEQPFTHPYYWAGFTYSGG